MKNLFSCFVFVAMIFTLTSFSATSIENFAADNETKEAVSNNKEKVGQIWIAEENIEKDGEYVRYYTLYATNISGKCYNIYGKVYVPSENNYITVTKDVPSYAYNKERAVKLITLPVKFVKDVKLFTVSDCKGLSL